MSFVLILAAFTRPSDMAWPFDFNAASAHYSSTKLEKMDTERALLGFFLAKLFKLDPDLIVGHDLYGYGLELLVHRMHVNKIPHWSRLGRLRRANMQTGKVLDVVSHLFVRG
jgi:DNA polymerase alpha subunit A